MSGPVRLPGTIQDAVDTRQELEALCAAVLSQDDYQGKQGQRYKTRSAWRQLAMHYGLTDCPDQDQVQVTYDNRHRAIHAEAKVVMQAPNGRQAVGRHGCHIQERCCPAANGEPCPKSKWQSHTCCPQGCDGFRHWDKPDDIAATAHTRAHNRATSDLLGSGDVSEEEFALHAEAAAYDQAQGSSGGTRQPARGPAQGGSTRTRQPAQGQSQGATGAARPAPAPGRQAAPTQAAPAPLPASYQEGGEDDPFSPQGPQATSPGAPAPASPRVPPPAGVVPTGVQPEWVQPVDFKAPSEAQLRKLMTLARPKGLLREAYLAGQVRTVLHPLPEDMLEYLERAGHLHQVDDGQELGGQRVPVVKRLPADWVGWAVDCLEALGKETGAQPK